MAEARLRIFEGLINSNRGYEDRLPFISDLIHVCLVVMVVFFLAACAQVRTSKTAMNILWIVWIGRLIPLCRSLIPAGGT